MIKNHLISVPPTKHYSFQYNMYNLQNVGPAGPGWFSWKFSLFSDRYTDISITNRNTVYTTSCRLTTRGFSRCQATTERHFHVFVRAHVLSLFLVKFSITILYFIRIISYKYGKICVVGGTVVYSLVFHFYS